mmetsp:Transcript_112463/g.318598  ORF Transcript_112463/g.318598 Transcript_112463/m.318598 type:complete len:676 (-) Transcript_112463:493-2520(-)
MRLLHLRYDLLQVLLVLHAHCVDLVHAPPDLLEVLAVPVPGHQGVRHELQHVLGVRRVVDELVEQPYPLVEFLHHAEVRRGALVLGLLLVLDPQRLEGVPHLGEVCRLDRVEVAEERLQYLLVALPRRVRLEELPPAGHVAAERAGQQAVRGAARRDLVGVVHAQEEARLKGEVVRQVGARAPLRGRDLLVRPLRDVLDQRLHLVALRDPQLVDEVFEHVGQLLQVRGRDHDLVDRPVEVHEERVGQDVRRQVVGNLDLAVQVHDQLLLHCRACGLQRTLLPRELLLLEYLVQDVGDRLHVGLDKRVRIHAILQEILLSGVLRGVRQQGGQDAVKEKPQQRLAHHHFWRDPGIRVLDGEMPAVHRLEAVAQQLPDVPGQVYLRDAQEPLVDIREELPELGHVFPVLLGRRGRMALVVPAHREHLGPVRSILHQLEQRSRRGLPLVVPLLRGLEVVVQQVLVVHVAVRVALDELERQRLVRIEDAVQLPAGGLDLLVDHQPQQHEEEVPVARRAVQVDILHHAEEHVNIARRGGVTAHAEESGQVGKVGRLLLQHPHQLLVLRQLRQEARVHVRPARGGGGALEVLQVAPEGLLQAALQTSESLLPLPDLVYALEDRLEALLHPALLLIQRGIQTFLVFLLDQRLHCVEGRHLLLLEYMEHVLLFHFRIGHRCFFR